MNGRRGLALIVVSAGLVLLAGVTLAGADEVVVSIDEVPAPVRATILAAAEGGSILEIEMEEEDGRVVYEAEIEIDGRSFEIEVAPDGSLLVGDDDADDDDDDEMDDDDDDGDDDDDDEEVISMREVPAAAQAALLELAGGAEIVEVVRESAGGVTVYDAEWLVDGLPHEATVTADGSLLVLEQVIEESAAPEAVISAAHDRLPPTAQLRYERKMIIVYEVRAEIEGEHHGILVYGTGTPVKKD